ncbi:MAG: LysM peptidoglycan-binding domain-containing protein [Chloroflexi bacterium]|nr:LysM peptidoglycan-binding domain-containing protein [Chloroflexota bacterium]
MITGRVALIAPAVVGLLLVSSTGFLSADEYSVREGDILSEIADRFGVTVGELAETNGIVDPDLILSGQVLLIPGSADGRAVFAQQGDQVSGGGTYVVQLGDTLSEIAELFGVPLGAIMEVNGLADPDFIREGQTLVIPVVESPMVPPVAPEIEALLDQFAAEEGLDPGIVKALAYLESGWQQGVVSATGAVGVMQIQPSTGYWLERDVFGYDLDIEASAYDNIKAGVRYLRLLLDLTGDIDQAVASYYQGYGAFSLGVLYEETIQYVSDVKAIRGWFWA